MCWIYFAEANKEMSTILLRLPVVVFVVAVLIFASTTIACAQGLPRPQIQITFLVVQRSPAVGMEFFAGSLGGVIRDKDLLPIQGAVISVMDQQYNTLPEVTSDAAGRYNVPNLAKSIYLVRIEADGFQSILKCVKVDDTRPTIKDFKMKPAN